MLTENFPSNNQYCGKKSIAHVDSVSSNRLLINSCDELGRIHRTAPKFFHGRKSDYLSPSLVGSYNFDPRSERLNSETALVFEKEVLAEELARAILDDLRYSRRVTAKAAAVYADPDDTLYRFRSTIGHWFEDEL